MVHIAVLIMVKNEKKRLHVTLESIKKIADSLVIYDTGSTDNTIQICKDFCEKNNIPLRLKEGIFENFEVSRNISLDFADSFKDIDYLLLLDTNDELKGGDGLRKIAEQLKDHESSGFYLCQQWWSGSLNKYYNIRFIKAHKEWRYKGCVHEYIETTPENKKAQIVKIDVPEIFLYQDRTQDDDKSGNRYHKDKELLLKEYEKNPKEPRTVFYLAQTFNCLKEFEDSYKYYKERTELDGFFEEKYYAYFSCGEISEKLKYDWYISFTWYMKAYEIINRVEPLLKIGQYYNNKKIWSLSYSYFKLATDLKFPDHCILFVDKLGYDYKRWHLLGIISYYFEKYEDGKNGVIKAIENGEKNNIDVSLDESNLKFYLDKEKELEKKENDLKVDNQNIQKKKNKKKKNK